MNAHMVPQHVGWRRLFYRRLQTERQPYLELVEKLQRCPAFFEEEMLQTRAITALAQTLLLAEDRRDRRHDLHCLLGTHKGIQPHAQVRISGKPAAYPH